MRVFTLAVCILITQFALGQHQVPKEYYNLAKKADSLYQAKSYREAAVTYTQAFKTNRWMGFMPEMYGAARAWARVGNLDSAFRKIDRILTYGTYEDKQKMTSEPAFKSLQQDKRWQPVKTHLAKVERLAKLYQPLRTQLDTIFQEDQKYRLMVDSVGKKYGFESTQVQSLWSKMAAVDSINLIKVKAILEKHGWLGVQEVGQQGNTTLFLVIQHADSATQVTCLPLMREAVKNDKAEASQLALLEDRVALKQDRKQIYSSQIMMDQKTGKYFVQPLEDPDNVDKRRAAVGLPPLAEYVKHWDITWDVEEYKKQQGK